MPTRISYVDPSEGHSASVVVTENTDDVMEEVNIAVDSGMKFVKFTRQNDGKAITLIAKNVSAMEEA